MRFLVAALAMFFLTCAAYCQEAQSPLSITISPDRDVYAVGDAIKIGVKLTNNSQKPIWIATPQEGSEQAYRYPYCMFEVLDEQGQPVKDSQVACKTVDPLFKDGFARLKPSETIEFYPGGYRLDKAKDLPAGSCTVIFSYSTDAKKESQWFGLYEDDLWAGRKSNEFWRKREGKIREANKFIRKIERLSVSSNPVIINLTGITGGISKDQALATAQEICRKEGWEWTRVNIVDKGLYWDIHTRWGTLGRNAFIRIDKKTGQPLEKHQTGS
ncbi:MAG: hypothetical protein PHJ00_07375 [Candidatus Omnitrophica bacterium]|nr:hypothetical protein [Candidatus Omnitrophota bacterium]